MYPNPRNPGNSLILWHGALLESAVNDMRQQLHELSIRSSSQDVSFSQLTTDTYVNAQPITFQIYCQTTRIAIVPPQGARYRVTIVEDSSAAGLHLSLSAVAQGPQIIRPSWLSKF